MSIIRIIIPILILFVVACKQAPDRPEPILDPSYEPTSTTSTVPPPAATPEPAQNAEGVWHYTCPNGCAGGGASAAPCSVCGTTLAHNSSYHNSAATTSPTITTTTPGATPPTTITPPATKTPEPAQNAAGVWHYTCPSGCAGGGGSAAPCSVCGTTLAHNSAYHN